MNVFSTALLGAALLAVTTQAMAADDTKADKGSTKTFNFTAQNSSGETGTVTLTPAVDGSTTVTISLKSAAGTQPAHIHEGSCSKLNPKPKYPLKNVVDGTSTTVVNVGIDKLDAGGFAVNVHKSTSDIATYVACADLSTSAMAPLAVPSPKASPAM